MGRAIFTLRIEIPEAPDPETLGEVLDIAEETGESLPDAMLRWLGDAVSDAESRLSEALPEGFYAKIDGGTI